MLPARWRMALLPQEHGAWMMFLAPLLTGLVLGGTWNTDVAVFVVAALAAFFLRQPLTLLVKVRVGRRPRGELVPALVGILLYAGIGGLALGWLVLRGYGFLLYLALPVALVLGWYLSLVTTRQERHQMALDLVAAGLLALSAPAAIWVVRGTYIGRAWWLWVLFWLQSAAATVYIFVRLDQRTWKAVPPLGVRLRHGWRALAYGLFNLALVALWPGLPSGLWLAYAVQAAEILWGVVVAPAVGQRPTRIGLRQLLVYALFTAVFLWAASRQPQTFLGHTPCSGRPGCS